MRLLRNRGARITRNRVVLVREEAREGFEQNFKTFNVPSPPSTTRKINETESFCVPVLGGGEEFPYIYGVPCRVYSVSIGNRNVVAVARRAFDGGVCANAPPSPGERLGYRPPAPRGESPYAQHSLVRLSVRPGPAPTAHETGGPPSRSTGGRSNAPPTPPTDARARVELSAKCARARQSTTQYFPVSSAR